MAKIAVVIPTIDGREDHYERCFNSYMDRTPGHEVTIFTARNHPTLGIAWQEGVEQINLDDFDYLHLTCDDVEILDGWIEPAIEAVEKGFIPAPYAINFDDTFISYGHPPGGGMEDWKPTTTTVSPFCKASWWKDIGPMIPLHMYTDDHFSHKARLAGYETRCRTGYRTRHHHAMERRGAGMEERARLVHDMHLYHRYLQNGTWPTLEECVR